MCEGKHKKDVENLAADRLSDGHRKFRTLSEFVVEPCCDVWSAVSPTSPKVHCLFGVI